MWSSTMVTASLWFTAPDGWTAAILLGIGVALLGIAALFIAQLRRQVEAAWAETGRIYQRGSARFAAVGDLLEDVLFETDTRHMLTYTNRAFHDLTGFRARDLRSGLSLADVLDVDDDTPLRRELAHSGRAGEVHICRTLVSCRDGARVPVALRLTAIAEQDRIAGWRYLIEPIDEQDGRDCPVEGVLSDILEDFNGTPRGSHQQVIGRALATIGRQVGADRCYHYAVSEDGEHLQSFSQWYAPGVSPMSGDRLLPGIASFRWTLERLREDGMLLVPHVERLDAAEIPEADRWRKQGITSLLVAPLWNGREIVGILGCETLGRARPWGVRDRQLLEAMAQLCQRVQKYDGTNASADWQIQAALDAASRLQQQVSALEKAYAGGVMSRSQFEEFLQQSRESSDLVVQTLQRAADS
jgi:PAS domain S-box-containing protein